MAEQSKDDQSYRLPAGSIEVVTIAPREATPEELKRMAEFIAEWQRTHTLVPIICTPYKPGGPEA
jgi:hypothetical protein